MKKGFLVALIAWALGGSAPCAALDAVQPGELIIDPPTLECLGFRWYIDGDDDRDAAVTMRYRKVGARAWRPALPPLRVQREVVNRRSGPRTCGNLFAGSILGLQPGTEYEVRLALADPDGGKAERTVRVTTRVEPVAPPAARTLHLYPEGWSGHRAAPAFNTLATAAQALQPGDRLLVHAGVHRMGPETVRIEVQGTATRPVVVRAAGDGEAIFDGRGVEPMIDFTGSDHLFFEELSFRNADTVFHANRERGATWITIRRCRLTDVVTGVDCNSPNATHWFIADNVMLGVNPTWHPRPQSGYMSPAFSGVKLYGRGHVICYNRVGKFGDCLSVGNNGRLQPEDRRLQGVAIDIYNNDLFEAKDDGIEADYGWHNIRIFRNRIISAHTALSAQPVYGGPAYFIRNLGYGITFLNLKLTNWCAGLEIYHNTLISADEGFLCAKNWQNGHLRNNLLLGATGYSINTGAPDPHSTLDYNGYRRARDDGPLIQWFDGEKETLYETLEDFRRGTGFERHGRMLNFDTFIRAAAPRPGVTYNSAVFDLRLKSGGAAVDAGLVLPTVNDGYAGKAPDLGCYELGQPIPHYGPREPGRPGR